MAKASSKAETAREFTHLTFELRDLLRRFLQKRLRENDISLTYEMQQIMACLWKSDGLKQQELADMTIKDKASLTLLIDNLVGRNLVTRRDDPRDRRSNRIYLTPDGKELRKKVEPWILELYEQVSKTFDIATIREGTEMVQKMINNLKEAE